MDHALRTISYIADIGDLLVVMARRGPVSASSPTSSSSAVPSSASAAAGICQNQTKICCHVFESDEVSKLFPVYCRSELSRKLLTIKSRIILTKMACWHDTYFD